jgi:sugar lactone lactonase YvrE
VLLTGLGVPESLRWHDGALWFSDLVRGGCVYRIASTGELERIVEVPGQPSGLGWLPDGRMLVVSMDHRCVYRLEADGALVRHAALGEIAWASLIAAPLWRALNAGGLVGRLTRGVSTRLDRPWIAKRSASPIAPDGICVHSDGATIWAANALDGECVRVAAGGKILDRVQTSQLTLSCVIGGADQRTLYAATVPMLDPDEALAARGGRIEAVRVAG